MIAAEACAEALQLVDIASGDRQARALRSERLRDRAAEPAARARHQRRHSRKIEHSRLPVKAAPLIATVRLRHSGGTVACWRVKFPLSEPEPASFGPCWG